MELVEDAETLTCAGTAGVSAQVPCVSGSPARGARFATFAEFRAGRRDWRAVLKIVSGHLQTDLGLAYDFETLGPPRSLDRLENYLQRADWQYYKSTTSGR